MIKQKQIFKHDPSVGIYGDCHRTVLACLLNLHPESVPHFGAMYWNDTVAWDAAVLEFLKGFDLSLVRVMFDATIGTIFEHMDAINPNVYYMLTGKSRNNTHHIVICKGSEIIWDPAQDDSGIVGPCDDGYYWIEHLIPDFMVCKHESDVTENLIQHQLKLEGLKCESLS